MEKIIAKNPADAQRLAVLLGGEYCPEGTEPQGCAWGGNHYDCIAVPDGAGDYRQVVVAWHDGDEYINLTPHTLNVHSSVEGESFVIPASGEQARVGMTTEQAGSLLGPEGMPIPVFAMIPGLVSGMPGPRPRTIYVVSLLTAQQVWASGRTDVYSPGPLIRGTDGLPTGCMGLQCNPISQDTCERSTAAARLS